MAKSSFSSAKKSNHPPQTSAPRHRGKALPPIEHPATGDPSVASRAQHPDSGVSDTHPAGEGLTRASEDYEIGYGKPPKAFQFQRGQSGNPKGRSRGSKNIWTILQEESEKIVVFSENGKPTKASKKELAIKSAMNKAAKGDLKALQLILKLYETHAPTSAKRNAGNPPSATHRAELDQAILDMLGLTDALAPSASSTEVSSAEEPDQSEPGNLHRRSL